MENNFHWTLAVVFCEEDARLRGVKGVENFTSLHPCALTLLKRLPAALSLKRTRFKAAPDQTFLAQLLDYFLMYLPMLMVAAGWHPPKDAL